VTDDPWELLSVATELARGAGRIVRADREHAGVGVAAKSTPTDLVTAVDVACERFLVEQLRTRRPRDGLLGEEGGELAGSSGIRWLLDPIDGTVNYLYGLPQYAVSIAAEAGGVTLAGCVYAPALDEMYTAVRGGGAWLQGRPLVPRWRAGTLDQAVVGTGFGYDAAVRAAQGRVVSALLPRIANIRRLGSAALDLCSVAAGRLDAYFEQRLAPWDRAAGALVAAEAGAVVSGLAGQPADGRITVAASPAVAGELVTLLAELGAADL